MSSQRSPSLREMPSLSETHRVRDTVKLLRWTGDTAVAPGARKQSFLDHPRSREDEQRLMDACGHCRRCISVAFPACGTRLSRTREDLRTFARLHRRAHQALRLLVVAMYNNTKRSAFLNYQGDLVLFPSQSAMKPTVNSDASPSNHAQNIVFGVVEPVALNVNAHPLLCSSSSYLGAVNAYA